MKRVVITGYGVVSPLGICHDEVWERLINGESGIEKIQTFNVDDLNSQVAGQLPTEGTVQKSKYLFNSTDYISPSELNRMDNFIAYGPVAATKAVEMSGLHTVSDDEKDKIGVTIGSGIGGLPTIEKTSLTFDKSGAKRVSPYFIPASLINMTSGYVGIKYNFKGPAHAVVTACATGTHAIGDAYRMIKYGEVSAMVAGGAEAAVSRIGMVGFCALRALASKYNDNPHEASRPWDKGRDGFVISEGSGVVILEEYEFAKKRGATIYGEIVGYGMSGDAFHITSPPSNGDGAYRAMSAALKDVNIDEIGYINAHGTSTGVGDLAELRAIEKMFHGNYNNVTISSTKSSVGHLLGAAGAVEAIFSLKALQTGIIPPTLNLYESEETKLNLTPLVAQEKKNINYALSNSFGFGGTNACLVFKKY